MPFSVFWDPAPWEQNPQLLGVLAGGLKITPEAWLRKVGRCVTFRRASNCYFKVVFIFFFSIGKANIKAPVEKKSHSRPSPVDGGLVERGEGPWWAGSGVGDVAPSPPGVE